MKRAELEKLIEILESQKLWMNVELSNNDLVRNFCHNAGLDKAITTLRQVIDGHRSLTDD